MVTRVKNAVVATYAPGATTVDPQSIYQLLDPLLRIPSMGGTTAESDAQWHVAELLTRMGLEVHTWHMDINDLAEQPDFPGMEVERTEGVGVLGIWRGTGELPALMINGHTDVVPPGDLHAWSDDPFTPVHTTIEGNKAVAARGACDMKGGLIAAIAAVGALRTAGFTPRGDILIAPVIGEEDGGLGTYALLREGLPRFYDHQIAGVIIPEPTSLALVPANAGALTFRLRVPGSAVHASRRTDGVSAIEKFYPILHALNELEARRNLTPDPLMKRWQIAYPLSIGTIHAGDWASTVPDLLIAEGRYGIALGEDVSAARDELEKCVADACERDPWLRDHPVEVQWWGGQFASGRSEPSADVIRQLANTHTTITGSSPEIFAAPYGSDLRLFAGMRGFPTVQYGPGDAGVAHAPNEYVFESELLLTHRVVSEYIAAIH